VGEWRDIILLHVRSGGDILLIQELYIERSLLFQPERSHSTGELIKMYFQSHIIPSSDSYNWSHLQAELLTVICKLVCLLVTRFRVTVI
jgi:hypothetical protein